MGEFLFWAHFGVSVHCSGGLFEGSWRRMGGFLFWAHFGGSVHCSGGLFRADGEGWVGFWAHFGEGISGKVMVFEDGSIDSAFWCRGFKSA